MKQTLLREYAQDSDLADFLGDEAKVKKLFEIKPPLLIPKNAQPEIENWDFIQPEPAKSDKENDDPNCSTNLVNKNNSTSKECKYCNEILDIDNSGKKHDVELCHEASKVPFIYYVSIFWAFWTLLFPYVRGRSQTTFTRFGFF